MRTSAVATTAIRSVGVARNPVASRWSPKMMRQPDTYSAAVASRPRRPSQGSRPAAVSTSAMGTPMLHTACPTTNARALETLMPSIGVASGDSGGLNNDWSTRPASMIPYAAPSDRIVGQPRPVRRVTSRISRAPPPYSGTRNGSARMSRAEMLPSRYSPTHGASTSSASAGAIRVRFMA